jgi:hypothetical protein
MKVKVRYTSGLVQEYERAVNLKIDERADNSLVLFLFFEDSRYLLLTGIKSVETK